MSRLFLHLFLLLTGSLDKKKYAVKRGVNRDSTTTYPYFTGNTLRQMCDHIVDDLRIPFKPHLVKEGEIVFLKTKYIDRFVKYMHPFIKHRYVLVTHSGDEDVPGKHISLLENDQIIQWFGINTTISHPKLTSIPIGFENNQVRDILVNLRNNPVGKSRLVYSNFDVETYPERVEVKKYFSAQSFCTLQPKVTREEYLAEVMRSKFIVSPRGNGIDCCRVWESLVLGTIPIVKTSPLDSLYEGLPILIVRDWPEVTEKFLEKKFLEMSTIKYNMDKLYADYWKELITNFADTRGRPLEALR